MMRVFLPATLATVARLQKEGSLAVPLGYAVTPALREGYAAGDQEELEYAAFTRAAQASLRLLAEDPHAPRRRVVVSADVPAEPDRSGGPGGGGGLVRPAGPVPLAAVVSIHVDDAAAEPDVAAAVEALPAADAGDPDADFTVSSTEDHELAWYDVSELDQLLLA